jgi:hypothetical protein
MVGLFVTPSARDLPTFLLGLLQAHKKPIMRYMADTCSEPGKENKELEHDKLVFLKQLKEVGTGLWMKIKSKKSCSCEASISQHYPMRLLCTPCIL